MPKISSKAIVTRKQLSKIKVPKATKTYTPVPYLELVEIFEGEASVYNLSILRERIETARDGNQMFATFELVCKKESPDEKEFHRAAGLRSSYDMSLSNGIVFGTQVIACSNLMFDGDLKAIRRHTQNVFEVLPKTINEIIRDGLIQFQEGINFLNNLKEVQVTESGLRVCLVDLMLDGTITSSQIKKVYEEFKEPSFDYESKDGTAFILHNSFTHIMKECNTFSLPDRTAHLNNEFKRIFLN